MNQSTSIHSTSGHNMKNPVYIGVLPASPVGSLWVAVSDRGLASVEWSMSQADFSKLVERRFNAVVIYDESRTSEPLRQITEYLAGDRRQYDLQLDLSTSTDFQRNVLNLTYQIP